jgi:hypothetical protein
MGDMEPVASVQAHTALEHRARCVARALPGAWGVELVHNSGDGATLQRRTSRAWSARDLRELESTALNAGGKHAPQQAHASISTRSECVTLRVKFGGAGSRTLRWLLFLCALACAAHFFRLGAPSLTQNASAAL